MRKDFFLMVIDMVAPTYQVSITKSMANIGTFLVGLAAILAIWFGTRKLKEFFLQKKIESAFLIINEVKLFIDDVNEIRFKMHFNDVINRSKIISDNLETLKKKIHQPIVLISGEKRDQLFEEIRNLQQICKSLSSAIYHVNRDDYDKLDKAVKLHLLNVEHESEGKLKLVYDKILEILDPIIKNY